MTDFTHTTTLTWSGTGGATFGGSLADSADSEVNVDLTVPSSAEARIDLAINAARVKHIFMLATADLTIKTNDAATGTPADTISLLANAPYTYSAAGGTSGPFSVDVTSFWVTLTSASTASLKIRTLQDSTP